MMKIIKNTLVATCLIAGMYLFVIPVSVTYADNPTDICNNSENAKLEICKDYKDQNKTVQSFVKKLVETLLYILAAVSVIVIIIAGIFYTLSGGDQSKVTNAKNILLYAVVGLIVAILSYAIVDFVLSKV